MTRKFPRLCYALANNLLEWPIISMSVIFLTNKQKDVLETRLESYKRSTLCKMRQSLNNDLKNGIRRTATFLFYFSSSYCIVQRQRDWGSELYLNSVTRMIAKVAFQRCYLITLLTICCSRLLNSTTKSRYPHRKWPV